LWWLQNVADVRVHRETKQRPIDRYADERPHLIALPSQAYDTASVVYRIADVEGFVCYQQNYYAVPWRFIGQALPLRITADEVIIYSPAIAEIARHRLFPRGVSQQRSDDKSQRPREDSQEQQTFLRERFAELGPVARRFLDGLLRDQRCGKSQARRVLALLGTYAGKDLCAALERAVRFGAYSASAVERILAAQAKPKSILQTLADDERRHVQPLLEERVPPRSTADYQQLYEDANDHGQANPTKEPGDEGRPAADEPVGPA
jgi:hypothetical protein